jgi:hypothetical protein
MVSLQTLFTGVCAQSTTGRFQKKRHQEASYMPDFKGFA